MIGQLVFRGRGSENSQFLFAHRNCLLIFEKVIYINTLNNLKLHQCAQRLLTNVHLSLLSLCWVNMKNKRLVEQTQPFSYKATTCCKLQPQVCKQVNDHWCNSKTHAIFSLKYADELHIKDADRCSDANSWIHELVNVQHYHYCHWKSKELLQDFLSLFSPETDCVRLSVISVMDLCTSIQTLDRCSSWGHLLKVRISKPERPPVCFWWKKDESSCYS